MFLWRASPPACRSPASCRPPVGAAPRAATSAVHHAPRRALAGTGGQDAPSDGGGEAPPGAAPVQRERKTMADIEPLLKPKPKAREPDIDMPLERYEALVDRLMAQPDRADGNFLDLGRLIAEEERAYQREFKLKSPEQQKYERAKMSSDYAQLLRDQSSDVVRMFEKQTTRSKKKSNAASAAAGAAGAAGTAGAAGAASADGAANAYTGPPVFRSVEEAVLYHTQTTAAAASADVASEGSAEAVAAAAASGHRKTDSETQAEYEARVLKISQDDLLRALGALRHEQAAEVKQMHSHMAVLAEHAPSLGEELAESLSAEELDHLSEKVRRVQDEDDDELAEGGDLEERFGRSRGDLLDTDSDGSTEKLIEELLVKQPGMEEELLETVRLMREDKPPKGSA